MHTSFSISERERLEMGMDRIKSNDEVEASKVEVQVVLENGEKFEHLGQLDYLGNRVNTDTGTIAMRAEVPNPDYRLLPGQHVRVELRQKQSSQVLVVPRRAVQTDLEGNFVMVVAEGNVAERRNVKLGRQLEQGIIVSDGVTQDDIVITQGLQRIRNGVPVRIQQSEQSAE